MSDMQKLDDAVNKQVMTMRKLRFLLLFFDKFLISTLNSIGSYIDFEKIFSFVTYKIRFTFQSLKNWVFLKFF